MRDDPEFFKFAKLFAEDQAAFFDAFSRAYSKLLALGCPAPCQPGSASPKRSAAPEGSKLSAEFRERAMHGSLEFVQNLAKDPSCDIHELEIASGRSALHKAAFWGHDGTVECLLGLGVDANVQDKQGDTALHDTARFGNVDVARLLAESGADLSIRNKHGKTAQEVAEEHSKLGAGGHKQVVQVLNAAGRRSRL